MVNPYLMHRRKAFRATNTLETLLSELAAAAVSAGGSGLANWAIWLGDTGTTNQGSIGGNLTAPGATPGIVANALNGRTAWSFNGATQYWEIAANSVWNAQVWSSFVLQDPVGVAATQIIFRHSYGQGTGIPTIDWGTFYVSGDAYFQARTSGGAGVNSLGAGSTNVQLLSGVWNAADTVTLYQDSTARTAGAGANAVPSQHLRGRIGAEPASPSLYFSGNIFLVAQCNLDLNSAASGGFGTARERVAAAINTYYGR